MGVSLSSRQLAYCAVFGGLAFLLRAMQLAIPIGGPFVIDLRGLPGIVGAALSGPIGGIVIGILAGLPAKIPLIDVPAFSSAYFLVGLLARRLKWLSALATIVGYAVAAAISWQMGFFPSFESAFAIILVRALAIIPIQLAILYAIYRRWPRAFESPGKALRQSGEGGG